MGCIQGSRSEAENETTPELEDGGKEPAKPAKKVQLQGADGAEDNTSARTSSKPQKTMKSPLVKFLLQFPKIYNAYDLLYSKFIKTAGLAEVSGNGRFDQTCPFNKLGACLESCGVEVGPNDIPNIMGAVGGDCSFKDLILGLSKQFRNQDGDECILSRPEDPARASKYDKLTKGFNIVAQMFSAIDDDNSGEITLTEFKEAFAGLGLGGDQQIYEKRMGELDFNNDKEITYPEFCVGISVWVGFVDEI